MRKRCLLSFALALVLALAGCAQQQPQAGGKGGGGLEATPPDNLTDVAPAADLSYELHDQIVARPRDDTLQYMRQWLQADQIMFIFDFSKKWSAPNIANIWVDVYKFGELAYPTVADMIGINLGADDPHPPEFTGSFMLVVDQYREGPLRWYLSYSQSGQSRGINYNKEAIPDLMELTGGVHSGLLFGLSYANQYADSRFERSYPWKVKDWKMEPTPIEPGKEIVLQFCCYWLRDTELDPDRQQKVEEYLGCPGELDPSDESIRSLFQDYPLAYIVKCKFE